MRLKTTYFICELDFGPGSAARGCCSSHDLFAAIKRLYCELYGDSGWGRAGAMLAVKNVDASTRLCIIRSATECRGDVHACLALLKAVGGAPVAVCVRSITSTIRTLRVAYASQHLRVTGRPFVEGAGAAPPMFWATLDADG